MAHYRKRPVVIEAFQLTYEMAMERQPAPIWFVEAVERREVSVHVTELIRGSQYCMIKTLEGTMRADRDDFIIQGVSGEIYPCKPDIFKKTYELVMD